MNPAIASRFPLVCRPRPLGLPLDKRIALLAEPEVAEGASHHEHVARASSVINLASLIASDVGLHDMAWDMCRRHYQFFAEAEHLDNPLTAVMATQPLVNIARLMTRGGDGRQAYDVLVCLYEAAQRCSTAEVRGWRVNVAAIIRSREGHRKVTAELWAALLTDGTHALSRCVPWAQVAASAAKYRGVGQRLWDGRQATVLALLERGLPTEARTVVEDSQIIDAPEKAVAAVLGTFCDLEGSRDSDHINVALGEALTLIELDEPPTAVFRTRLALTALALADAAGRTPKLHGRLRKAVLETARTDAYAARAACAAFGDQAQKELRSVIINAGFGLAVMTPDLENKMLASVAAAEDRLHQLLGARGA
ncbi:hypothetical protein ABH926_008790 [Catenulispora sp. GP43]|uniref:hypothetical protein n=1 Tax=Catenulispora sp. GP43 TaxID=3156263 RepID=UPI0035144E39